MRHILNVGGDNDRRMRMAPKVATQTKRSRALCGETRTYWMPSECMSKATAAHGIKYEGLKPEWTADMCPECRKKL